MHWLRSPALQSATEGFDVRSTGALKGSSVWLGGWNNKRMLFSADYFADSVDEILSR